MPADETVMGELHTQVCKVLSQALEGQVIPGYKDPDTEEQVPATVMLPSAAIIAAATKFLKDNNITCVASKDNALGELEQIMAARAERRAASKTDLSNATEQTKFLRGLN